MKRWQWWLIGLALLTGVLALLMVFWPKLIESVQRCCRTTDRREESAPELDEPVRGTPSASGGFGPAEAA